MQTIEHKLTLLRDKCMAPEQIFNVVIRTVQSPYSNISETNISDMNKTLLKKRYRNLVYPRQLYSYIAYYATNGYSLKKLGSLIGKDHSTILHGKKTISNYLDINMADIKHDILKITEELESLCYEETDYVI